MNYLSIYNLIVSDAKSEGRRKRKHTDPRYIYYERHHIIPKCLGGTNDSQNLILLTAREHFVAHQLLVKIHPGERKLVFALRMMCRNNKEYEWISRISAITSSESQKGKSYGYKFPKGHLGFIGKNNGMFGKVHSTETKELMSTAAINRGSEHLKGIQKTDSHKDKISKAKRKQKYKLVSPEGTETTFDMCRDASNFSGISTAVLIKLAGNRYKFNHCRNWKCFSIPL